MRAFVTGQVGVDKGPFLEAVKAQARARGVDVEVCHVGKMMYAEAPDVPAGRILNLPITRLAALRRSVFKEIHNIAQRHEHLLVNSHATFRWRHGLFAAFDFDQIKDLNPDVYITLVDNADSVHERLLRDHNDLDHSLKDIMVWREEEILATEIIASISRGFGHFFMLSRGRGVGNVATLYDLLFEPKKKKAYLSFPMTHVMDIPQIQSQIADFQQTMSRHLICFNPGDVDECLLHTKALRALEEGRATIEVMAEDGPVSIKTTDVAEISSDILGQTYARDFKMIDQSDMIISLVPELPDGKPALSSGVERELHHAFEAGKEVFVIWACRASPSPFVTKSASRVFATAAEAIEYFRTKGYFAEAKAASVR
jgi:adenylate kinase